MSNDVNYQIASYIRLSMEDRGKHTDKKEDSVSIRNQRKYIQEFIRKKEEFQGAKLIEFLDDGYSGTNFNRPGVTAMLAACRAGALQCIIVKDLSRFGRNYLEVGAYLEQIFPLLGVRFIAINDGFDSNQFLGQTGGMEVAFRNFLYEMYSRDLSVKVKTGVSACMKRGEYHAGYIVYGYQKATKKGGLVIEEAAASVVRRIFREVAAGKRIITLAQELNAEGVPTRLTYRQTKGGQQSRCDKKDTWTRDQIYAIIHNEVYCGDMVYRKAIRKEVGSSQKVRQSREHWLVLTDHHEAIVSRELFTKANERIRKRRAVP